MRIKVLSLFPKMFDGILNESIIKRAIDDKKVNIDVIDLRSYSKDKHNKVDDTIYGGGAGMLIKCEPVFDAIDDLKTKNTKVIMLSPDGVKYNQEKAYELSKEKNIILLCGHYEGFDERIKTICDEEISIGDYVLTGGELPSMVITDSVVRLLPGVIEELSHKNESFNDNLLDYPTYTKPRNYKGIKVPEVLLSGDHKKINEWRRDERLKVTKEKRPDLLTKKVKLEKNGIKEKKNKIFIDDVKNIKVTEVKDVKKTGIYKLFKTKDINAITVLDPKLIIGYKLKGRAKNKSVDKILIVKESFIRKVALKNIQKKIDVLTYRFNLVLSNPEDDEGTSRVLGEAEMLKQMIISMYAKYLGAENLDKIIKNINYLVAEFVKAKTLQNSFVQGHEKTSERRR